MVQLADDALIKQIDLADVKIGQRIGKGTFGEVFKGVWNGTEVGILLWRIKSTKPTAGVKFLTGTSMNEQFLQEFYKEVNIMRYIQLIVEVICKS
jgi:serine/threonine protein kinase